MNFTNILYAAVILGAIGVFLGLILSLASRLLAVRYDERTLEILSALPGLDCRGCGFSGCIGYAAAINEGAPIGMCLSGAECAEKISGIMGIKAAESEERRVAFVQCAGNAIRKYDFTGVRDCRAAAFLPGGGPSECNVACLGLGSCAAVCPSGAISFSGGVAKVDREKCTGCMACAAECPKKIISSIPYGASVAVPCASKEKGSVVSRVCSAGCIGCRLCEKVCPFDAVTVKNNLAVIDYTRCTSCGACVKKCSRSLIRNLNQEQSFDNELDAVNVG